MARRRTTRSTKSKVTKAARTGRARARSGPGATVVPFEVDPRVERQASMQPFQRKPGVPLTRPLQIYTLDPSVSHRLGGVATVNVPYEDLEPGPVGSLFSIDASGAPKPLSAEPLDLGDPKMLITGGLSPSPSDGQFHSQMVYAVCSLTYAAFRRALGREIAWALEMPQPGQPLRLKVRPFGFGGRNAGYSREAGDLSFGFFRASRRPAGFTVPNGWIFTALSHDVIAHETTHALLDALRATFNIPSNPDVPAFHEGFADLVALFLHFSYPGIVEQAIRESRGALSSASLLSDLAREFGYARSSPLSSAPLRSAIDVSEIVSFDSDLPPGAAKGPTLYRPDLEMHALGSVLVSAVFEAFTTIVRRKCERYFRLAGIAPRDIGRSELSDELVRAVAQEASEIAAQFLSICIRAIDYCPPCDMELGEYLRALITADADLVVDDKWGYREALMRSFRRRELFPDHVGFMTEGALRWQPPEQTLCIPGLKFSDLRFRGEPGHPASAQELRRQADALGTFVAAKEHAPLFHLIAPGAAKPRNVTYAGPLSVQSIRCARRVAPDGRILFDLVAEVTQSCTVERGGQAFDFNGGCTIVIDPYGEVRYAVYKKLDSAKRQTRQQEAIRGPLRRLWTQRAKKWVPRHDMLGLVHGIERPQQKGGGSAKRSI